MTATAILPRPNSLPCTTMPGDLATPTNKRFKRSDTPCAIDVSPQGKKPKSLPVVGLSPVPLLVASTGTPGSPPGVCENRALTAAHAPDAKLTRKIKNRESAQMWREKRRRKIQDLEAENNKLVVERDHLLERVSRIEQQNIAMQSQLLELKMMLTSGSFADRPAGFFASAPNELGGEARPGVFQTPERSISLDKPKALVLDGWKGHSLPFGHRPAFLAFPSNQLTSQQSSLLLLVQRIWYHLVLAVFKSMRSLIWSLYWIGKGKCWSPKCYMHKLQ